MRDKKSPDDADQRPGRVTVDDRGRNVWQWNGDNLDSTTTMLKQLDNDALAIEATTQIPRPDLDFRTAPPKQPKPNGEGSRGAFVFGSRKPKPKTGGNGGGFNPYDNS